MKNDEATKNYEPVIVQNNPLFEEDELRVEDVEAHSDSSINWCGFEEHSNKVQHQILHDISKTNIIPWEELQSNRNQRGLGYENQNSFHLPNYSKLVLFVSVGFLQECLQM